MSSRTGFGKMVRKATFAICIASSMWALPAQAVSFSAPRHYAHFSFPNGFVTGAYVDITLTKEEAENFIHDNDGVVMDGMLKNPVLNNPFVNIHDRLRDWEAEVAKKNQGNGVVIHLDFRHLPFPDVSASVESVPLPPEVKVNWQDMPGAATAIAADAQGHVTVLGTHRVGEGGQDFSPYLWTGSTWQLLDGGGVRIALGGGRIWLVNHAGVIYSRPIEGGTWEPFTDMTARDIAILPNGAPVIIGTELVPGTSDYVVLCWEEAAHRWNRLPGRGVRVAAGPHTLILLNHEGRIFRFDGNNFAPLGEGRALEAAVMGDDTVYVIGTGHANAYDYGIYRYDGHSWPQVTGGAVKICAGGNTLYVANGQPSPHIYRANVAP